MNKIKIALGEYGITGTQGTANTAQIIKYFHDIGFQWVNSDEVAWCAAFVSWVLKKCNINITSTLVAKDFLAIGEATTQPEMGDVAVIYGSDGTSQWSHVSFFVCEHGSNFYLLGGNQNNSVIIKAYKKTLPISFRKID